MKERENCSTGVAAIYFIEEILNSGAQWVEIFLRVKWISFKRNRNEIFEGIILEIRRISVSW